MPTDFQKSLVFASLDCGMDDVTILDDFARVETWKMTSEELIQLARNEILAKDHPLDADGTALCKGDVVMCLDIREYPQHQGELLAVLDIFQKVGAWVEIPGKGRRLIRSTKLRKVADAQT